MQAKLKQQALDRENAKKQPAINEILSQMEGQKHGERMSVGVQQILLKHSTSVFAPRAAKVSHHPKVWWEDQSHPERAYFLKEAVLELDDDSEDDQGIPLYKESRCPLLQSYLLDINEKQQKFEKTRQTIQQKNAELKIQGKAPIDEPKSDIPT